MQLNKGNVLYWFVLLKEIIAIIVRQSHSPIAQAAEMKGYIERMVN